MFLAIPLPALVHLPASSYNILWYSLLLLSKLHLLFHAQFDIPGIQRHDIHTLGLALVKKMEGNREDDALTNCEKMLRSMLVWLENTTCEQQQGQVDLSTQGSGCEHKSTRLHHLGLNGLQGHAKEATSSRSGMFGCRSPTATLESPAVYPGGEREDRGTTLWEKMLDELDWHEDPSDFVRE